MLSLLFDFLIQFFSFFLLVNKHQEVGFALVIVLYYVIHFAVTKKLPNLLFYGLLFTGSIIMRSASPSALEWMITAGVLLCHLFYSSRTKIMGVYRLSAIIIVSGVGLCAIYILPVFAAGLRYILLFVVTCLAFVIARPLMYLVSLINFNNDSEVEERFSKVFKVKPADIPKFNESSGNSIILWIVLVLVGSALLLWLIYKIAQKKKNFSIPANITKSTDLLQAHNQKPLFRKSPSNPIRKCVYSWEKKLSKPYGRNSGESFSSWVNRLSAANMQKVNTDLLISIYSTIRYKDETADHATVLKFKQEMKKFSGLNTKNKSG